MAAVRAQQRVEGKERGSAKGGGDKIIKHFIVPKKNFEDEENVQKLKTYQTLNPRRSFLAAAVRLRKIVGLRRRSEKSSGDSCDFCFNYFCDYYKKSSVDS